ncbi:MAG: NRAMP family divalent metal transporter [Sphingobacteriales bacterium]|jgi:Mn2+/Fe2+ NRAMP family transporter
MKNRYSTILLSAAFLMATSAIGPGFLTQTAFFTKELGASFGFVILISILLDLGAQLNIWAILSVSGKKAQDLSNDILPGLGFLLALLIVLGGLAFNIGNLAGCGLGLEVLFGIPDKWGALISAILSITLFWSDRSSSWIDLFTKVLGILMIGLTIYVCFEARPPIGEAIYRSIIPEKIDAKAIITLVGGTVGGYISFAGAHRLMEDGLIGASSLPKVKQSAATGILLASGMRILLFLAAWGVVASGLELQENNPAASVFKLASGPLGYTLFGVVMWSAAITSVVGSAYTSYSFMLGFHSSIAENKKWIITVFVMLSAMIYFFIGKPVKILVMAGMLNGFILPIALLIILIAAWRMRKQGYQHPVWFYIMGGLVIIATGWLSIHAVIGS